MVTKIGINGFARIGRMCLRAALRNPAVKVVAINSTSDIASSARLIKYDSVHGILGNRVEVKNNEIFIDGQSITVFSDRNPANLAWGRLGVDIVIEATGSFKSGKDCDIYLQNGAKKVIISAPAKDSVPTIVMGVNEGVYRPEIDHVVSNASCTTNCLAPVVKVLHDCFGVSGGLMSTVHAFTSDQRSIDNRHSDPRRSRSCVQSIIPTSTGAAKAIGLVMPELKGKFNGVSLRVPVIDVSLVDLVVDLQRDVSVEEINETLRIAANTSMKGIIEYCNEPLVSVDFIGNDNSAIIDGLSAMVIGKRTAKILAWYDNEWGYSCRMIDLAKYMGDLLHVGSIIGSGDIYRFRPAG